jgi:hypothetical protein
MYLIRFRIFPNLFVFRVSKIKENTKVPTQLIGVVVRWGDPILLVPLLQALKILTKQKTSNDINSKFCEICHLFTFCQPKNQLGKYTPPYGTTRGDPILMDGTVVFFLSK